MPLVEFFRRGDVARDVRLLAAQGALAPRGIEQLTILVLLLGDPDPEIRRVARDTIDQIPEPLLTACLARSDVPLDVREFFADRGVFPAEIPPVEVDGPLIETDPRDGELADKGHLEMAAAKVAKMGFADRLKAAIRGPREIRGILIRDANKTIAMSVLSNPKLSEQEVEGFARIPNLSEDVLRVIGTSRAWLRNYGIVVALTKNPKTPLALSLNLMAQLTDRDVQRLSMNHNIPDPLRFAARRRVTAGNR